MSAADRVQWVLRNVASVQAREEIVKGKCCLPCSRGSQKDGEADAAGTRQGGLQEACGSESTCRLRVSNFGRRRMPLLLPRISGTRALAPHMLKPPFRTEHFWESGKLAQGKRRSCEQRRLFIPQISCSIQTGRPLIGPIHFLQRFTALLDSRPHKRAPSLSLACLPCPQTSRNTHHEVQRAARAGCVPFRSLCSCMD
jgi:hypothetical protein